MNAVRLKVWVIDESQIYGVKPNTILTRFGRGNYPKVRVKGRHMHRVVVGEHGQFKPRPFAFECKYDLSGVDWSKSNSQIAREIGCNPSTILQRRKKLGLPASPRRKSQRTNWMDTH